MGKSAGSPPEGPNPNVVIPLQTQANKDQFDYALQGQRYNQFGPTGSQVWKKQTTPGSKMDMTAGNFDAQAYLAANPDVAAAGTDPFSHFTNYGSKEGRGFTALDSGKMVDGETTWSLWNQLSPNQQQLFDTNEASQLKQSQLLDALTGRLSGSLGESLDYSGVPALSSGQYNQDAADALYRQNTRYLDVQNKNDQSGLEARLAEQGFVPGTPGYMRAMQTFQDTSNRAYADARDRATSQGTQYGQQQQTLDNQTRSQAIAELLQKRGQPINELNAIRSGTQVSLPTGVPQGGAGAMQGTDVMGAYNNQYQGQLGAYNARVGSDNANTQGLGMLGNALAMYLSGGFSDARLKDDIVLVGQTPGGTNIYSYTIFGRQEYGVLAQELQATNPRAVKLHESGFLMVDYSKVK